MSTTENLLQKLEEKMMVLLSEIEDLRKEVQHLNHENSTLKVERDSNMRKLQDLLSLLESVNGMESNMMNTSHIAAVKPVLIQEQVIQEQAS